MDIYTYTQQAQRFGGVSLEDRKTQRRVGVGFLEWMLKFLSPNGYGMKKPGLKNNSIRVSRYYIPGSKGQGGQWPWPGAIGPGPLHLQLGRAIGRQSAADGPRPG